MGQGPTEDKQKIRLGDQALYQKRHQSLLFRTFLGLGKLGKRRVNPFNKTHHGEKCKGGKGGLKKGLGVLQKKKNRLVF